MAPEGRVFGERIFYMADIAVRWKTEVMWLKPNREKPRERGWADTIAHSLPAVNGGPTPLRGKPRERG